MQNLTRIKSIEVKKLFGYLDHTIELKLKERITLLHGLNGSGKTTILKLLSSIFGKNIDYSCLYKVPFEEFKVGFIDDSYIKVIKIVKNDKFKIIYKNPKDSLKDLDIPLKYFSKKHLYKEYEKIQYSFHHYDIPIRFLSATNTWLDFRTKTEFNNLYEVIDTYRNQLPVELLLNDLHKLGFLNYNEKLSLLLANVSLQFFDVYRLLKQAKKDYKERYSLGSGTYYESAMKLNADELASTLQKKLTELANLSQNLDSEFTAKLLDPKLKQKQINQDDVIDEFKKLENKREHLMEIGLLDKDQHFQKIPEENLNQAIDISDLRILSLNIEDTEEKLSLFDDLNQKASLMLRIINEKISYSGKKIMLDKETGIKITTKTGEQIQVTDLSSGEQQELIFLYGLLFKTKPKSMILIDEPELSLHVTWQHKFLNDLKDISDLIDIDFLIATHSPQIINNKIDLMVELKAQ